jgi:tRNA modification GTPase
VSTSNDTIAAIATPPGRGGVGVIRISGRCASAVAEALLGRVPQPRHASFLPFRDSDGQILDSGLAVYFPGPASFTGEDVLELHAHGSPVVLDLLLRRLLALGVRLARPGEFSERAFLNDKMDLAQAEAIADLINASTERAARSAQRSLQGEFSRQIDALVEELVQLRQYVEAAIDFVDEDIDFLAEGAIEQKLQALRQRLEVIQSTARQGRLLRDGLTLVIVGKPNVGKSSLLNQLAGRDAAIVTDIAGTTRDLLREYIQIDGLPLHIVDTAGLRDSADPVEQEGIRRAREALRQSDGVLFMVDDRDSDDAGAWLGELPANVPVTQVRNKIDLSGQSPALLQAGAITQIRLSLKTGEGMELLKQHLKQTVGYQDEGQDVFIARRRHLDALGTAHAAIRQGLEQLRANTGAELLAEDLRTAQNALSEITGAFTNEDLLDRIFAGFCIGK